MFGLKSIYQVNLFLLFGLVACSASHELTLLNGPIVTHTTMHSVLVWVQTNTEGRIQLEYWKSGSPETKWYSRARTTSYEGGYTAKLLAREGIDPGTRYDYRILLGESKKAVQPKFSDSYKIQGAIPLSFQSKPRWRWIPDNATNEKHSIFDFRIAMGSCTYINQKGTDREGGKPYGSQYQIFESIYEKKPAIMLWLGDNIYYRENDFESREGLIARWSHDRQTPELSPLFANTINYATWDDHDYGPNNIGRNYWLKEQATEVFKLMWGNPSAGLPETPGIFTYVNWGDVNIYLLDNRTYLTPSESNPQAFGQDKALLGKEQVDWLIDHLAWNLSQSADDFKSYPARFNLIVMGSSVLSESGSTDEYRNFPEEWQYLMDRIVSEKIRGVVFLTGDLHSGQVNKIEHVWQNISSTLYEVTSSPLTAGASTYGEHNPARLDIFAGVEDRITTQNFVTLDFQGPLNDRKMLIRYWDCDGKLLNQKRGADTGTPTDLSVIHANDLIPRN